MGIANIEQAICFDRDGLRFLEGFYNDPTRVKRDTVHLLNSSWSSPKNFWFRKFWKSYLDQNLLRITHLVSDLTGDQ
jgi:hypothetical protein